MCRRSVGADRGGGNVRDPMQHTAELYIRRGRSSAKAPKIGTRRSHAAARECSWAGVTRASEVGQAVSGVSMSWAGVVMRAASSRPPMRCFAK